MAAGLTLPSFAALIAQNAGGRRMSEFDRELETRLVRYVQVDTQSDVKSPTQPSTARQLDLSRMLVAELLEIGAAEVTLTDYGVVLATIPATTDADVPVIGLLAHVDTAPA